MFDDDLNSLLLPTEEEDPGVQYNDNNIPGGMLSRPLSQTDLLRLTSFDMAPQATFRNEHHENRGRNMYRGSDYSNIGSSSLGVEIYEPPLPSLVPQSVPLPEPGKKKSKVQQPLETDSKSKRRAAVAAASRATRAKRKRELEELKTKNKRLEKERQDYLGTIGELQLKVQALRETGSIDLRMENDLLKAELAEHKRFLGHFRNIAQGLPTTDTAKKVMLIQSADSAVAKVLALLSTSVVDPTWRFGAFRGTYNLLEQVGIRFQRIPNGSSAATTKRISLRFDISISGENHGSIAELVWAKWTREGQRRGYSNYFRSEVESSIKQSHIDIGDEFNVSNGFKKRDATSFNEEQDRDHESMVSKSGMPKKPKDRGRLKVFELKERLPSLREKGSALALVKEDEREIEKLVVVTGREADICSSSFLCSKNIGQKQSSLRNKPIQLQDSATGRVSAVVLARTYANPKLDKDTVFATRKDVSYENSVIEGFVLHGNEQNSTATLTYSLPLDTKECASVPAERVNNIIDDDGLLTKGWEEKLMNEFGDLFTTESNTSKIHDMLPAIDFDF